jgi:hypothetical protein
MAGKGKTSKTKMKRRTNPMARTVVMKRPKVNFDGNTLNGDTFSTNVTTGAPGYLSYNFSVDCSALNTTGVITSSYYQRALTNFYSEYWYRSLKVEWLPLVGPADVNAAAQVYMCYLDNAEHISTVVANSVAGSHLVNRDIILADRDNKMWNAWEHVSFNIPLTKRNKTFAVNQSLLFTDMQDVDRSVQGLLATFYQSATSSSVVLGRFRLTYLIELRGLDIVPT